MSSGKTAFKTIGEFLFQENKTFVIPNYQRGYKWAVKEEGKNETAVEKLMDDLIKADKNQDYFLQGVTVSEDSNNIILIDGQQRTTTLYLILWCLVKENISNIDLQYDIRQKSKNFIIGLKLKDNIENPNKIDSQDIYYFKKAIEQIKNKLKSVEDKSNFKNYLLNKVNVLYITIDQDKATRTFTMMNGSKATMLQEELVKAEMLRRVSFPEIKKKQVSTSIDDNLVDLKEIITQDWETNALRSRYAREWDKWLYWWNRQEVKDFFDIENPMGLLLKYYCWNRTAGNSTEKATGFSFDNFKKILDNKEKGKQKTKLIFKELRDSQKSFEDIFNKPKIHNYLKMSLICSSGEEDKYNIITYFISKKNEGRLTDDYAKWRLVGATHLEITDPDKSTSDETKESRAQIALQQLSGAFVYQNADNLAAKQLLRLNVEEDNKLLNGKGRKFDFGIYGNKYKSLEHIHPKSKAYHKAEIQNKEGDTENGYKDGNDEVLGYNEPEGKEWLNRDEMGGNCSEHCVGNLVLLDKNENSKFNNKRFDIKKDIYFNVEETFKSRNLLHTISVFAKSTWTKENIKENQQDFIKRFKEDYYLTSNNNSNENK